MITIKQIDSAVKKGLSIQDYVLLRIVEDGSYYLFGNQDLTNLQVLGLLDFNGNLTDSGKRVLDEIMGNNRFEFAKLHISMQERLKSIIGKKQVEGFGGVYFIPTLKELEQFLNRFWKEYPRYTDYSKIEKILLKHIEKCAKERKFAPAIKYFISKQGVGSQLANAYENWEEIDKVVIEKAEPNEIKNLF